MKKIAIFILTCTLFGKIALAQESPEKLDKLKKQLAESKNDSARGELSFSIAIGYRFSNVDSFLLYADQALEIARKLNYRAAIGASLSLIGAILLESGRLPESLQ